MKVSKLIPFLFLFILLSACSKEKISYDSVGWIGGIDLTECACCGGRYITIEDEITNGRFNFLPEGSDIDLSNAGNEPVEVKLNWNLLSDCAGIMHVEVTKVIAVK